MLIQNDEKNKERIEFLEIICDLERRVRDLKDENSMLKKQLEEKEAQIADCEAVIADFTELENEADGILAGARSNADRIILQAKLRSDRILNEAKARRDETIELSARILARTHEESSEMRTKAASEVHESWESFNRRSAELRKKYEELERYKKKSRKSLR